MTMADATHDVYVERRSARRYRSPEGHFLVENAENRQPIGDLLDISNDGLAFIYSNDVDAVNESSMLNVVSPSGEIHLERVPYSNRNDFDYIRNYPFNANRMRRRGVSFIKLSAELLEHIEKFIGKLRIKE